MQLYFKLPFGKLHQRQTDIIALAERLGRSPSAVAMKMVNFASLDPAITSSGRSGLTNNSKLDQELWRAFQADWTTALGESDAAVTDRESDKESVSGLANKPPTILVPTGESEGMAWTKFRRGQSFFRRAVLANSDLRCCITGIAEPALLVASHIIPWQSDEKHRLNPRNGLALSGTFDRAFDRGLITIDENLKVAVCHKLLRHSDKITRDVFSNADGQRISNPKKISLDVEAIAFHNEWARATNVYL